MIFGCGLREKQHVFIEWKWLDQKAYFQCLDVVWWKTTPDQQVTHVGTSAKTLATIKGNACIAHVEHIIANISSASGGLQKPRNKVRRNRPRCHSGISPEAAASTRAEEGSRGPFPAPEIFKHLILEFPTTFDLTNQATVQRPQETTAVRRPWDAQ